MADAVLWVVIAVNLVTFAAFGLDKWRSRRRGWRVPESTLLALTWATGLFGAWAAVSLFRHKTRKTSFRIKLALVTAGNLLWLVLWLATR